MKIKLTKDDLKIANAAGEETTRPSLAQVHIQEGEIWAANGFLLVRKEVKTGGIEGERYFPASIAKVASDGEVEVEIAESTVRLSNSKYTIEIPISQKAGTFSPDDSLSLVGETKAVVALSLPLLRKMLKSLPDKGILRLKIAEVSQPVEFQAMDDDGRIATGLIMPMYTQWDTIEWKSDKLRQAKKK